MLMTRHGSENIKLNSVIKHDKLLFKKGIQGLTFSGPDPDRDLGIMTFSLAIPSPISPQCESLVTAQECTGLTSDHYVINLGA